MNPRSGLALTALALTLAGAPAYAAAKPACFQISDDPGDAAQAPNTPSSASLDILSGDIATGKKNLVAVLRFASVAADPMTTPGATYEFGWTVGGVPQSLSLAVYQDGSKVASYQPNASFGSNTAAIPVGALVDPATKSITWSVPRRLVPQLKKAGAKFSGLAATARPSANLRTPTGTGSFTFLNGDSASSPKSYVDQARTCVKGV